MMIAGLTRLERVVPERNMARFYELSIETNLFGETVLVRRWGRIGSWGRELNIVFTQNEAAANELMRIGRLKEARGYRDRS